jgi:Fe-S-cluster containining protein
MTDVRRFACTQCGKCCNRSPEVELSEAGGLADAFVFRLMFRLYRMPRQFGRNGPESVELFYQKKRLLNAHAARAYPKKVVSNGKALERTQYLMISALVVDTQAGACAALVDERCSIHPRRPLACRTVPSHYSRPDALAERDFDAFVSTPGYRCDTSAGAAPFLQDGRIVDAETLQARADALTLAQRDRAWKEAIFRRMKRAGGDAFPTLTEVEANAAFAAMTVSMRLGWETAVEARLLSPEACRRLIERQLAIIEYELGRDDSGAADSQTLREMRVEYQKALSERSSGRQAT